MNKLRSIFALAMLIGCVARADETPKQPINIPTTGDVGAGKLPDEIVPVNAPFPMPIFQKPKFPARTVNITSHGARPRQTAREQIQAAIDEVSKQGGGTVVIPAGKWLTGRIELKSNVHLKIDEGAEVTFSGDVADYQPAVFTRNEGVEVMSLGALIYANGQDNIAITGQGKLIGPPRDCSIQKQVMNASVIENFIDAKTPVAERMYEGHDGSYVFLPMAISPTHCTNVYIEGVTLEHMPFWNVVPVYCDGVIIRGVTVNSVGAGRTDGIDIESTRNVLIEYCTLNCGDDCFTLKAGRGEDGLRVNKATENVLVRFCLAQKGEGGITVGSETAGMIRNVHVHDAVFDNTKTGVRFKTRRPRGGGGENISFERIRMTLTGPAFDCDMLGSKQYVGELAVRLPARPIDRLTPVFRHIVARDIVVDKASWFFRAIGIPESPFSDVRIENAQVSASELWRVSDVKGITICNATIATQQPKMTFLDAEDVSFENVQWTVPGGELSATVTGEKSANIRFSNCVPARPKGWKKDEWSQATSDSAQ